MVSFPGTHPQTLRRLDTLNRCSVYKHIQESEPFSATCRCFEVTILLQVELQHSGAEPGTHDYPHTCLGPHTLGNSGKDRDQPLSVSLVPKPVLCMKVNPTICSWYRSTVCTNYDSAAREVTFYVSRTSVDWYTLVPALACHPAYTHPQFLSLQVVAHRVIPSTHSIHKAETSNTIKLRLCIYLTCHSPPHADPVKQTEIFCHHCRNFFKSCLQKLCPTTY